MTVVAQWEFSFEYLSERLIDSLQSHESLTLELVGENSQFMRFNRARVRQTGVVMDSTVKLSFQSHQHTAYRKFPLTGDRDIDLATGLESLQDLRQEIDQLPEDPFLVLPENQGSTREVYTGDLLPADKAVAEILSPVSDWDLTGIYASGSVIRANHNSAGGKHWFGTESFCLDYSAIGAEEKAVKQILADRVWDSSRYHEQLHQVKTQLQRLERPVHTVKPGRYRVYLAPAATADLIGMLSWGAVSESSLRQGGSALAKLRQGKTLSSLFTLQENFQGGNVPRFNELGELAPTELAIVSRGELVNTLVSRRTAKEYGIVANGASQREGLRSAEVSAGSLKSENILPRLATGLYLSNLHYLNWSDRPSGRITGMTRYACFWVENGEIVAPIQDLRFDDSLYAFLGENLLALTEFREFIPETDTYEVRSLGGQLMPGLLVEDFTFTL
jgi:predicted Zn-dependent protease